MKFFRAMVLPILLAGVGCVTFPSLKDESAPKTGTAGRPVANAPGSEAGVGTRQEIALPPINPDDVTDSNAREKAEALRRELSRQDK
jgi:hypothetical protein